MRLARKKVGKETSVLCRLWLASTPKEVSWVQLVRTSFLLASLFRLSVCPASVPSRFGENFFDAENFVLL